MPTARESYFGSNRQVNESSQGSSGTHFGYVLARFDNNPWIISALYLNNIAFPSKDFVQNGLRKNRITRREINPAS